MLALCLLLLAGPGLAQEQAFEAWLVQVRQEALTQGIAAQTLDLAFADLKPSKAILELERQQPEKRIPLARYLRQMVPNSRVKAARTRMARHRALLEQISAHYRVQPCFLVALWAIESDFGRNMGKTPLVMALATLSYGAGRPERRDLFRQELLAALRILDQGIVLPARLAGSWAGAMGQCQFMPSSFLALAVDHDGDGQRDIWHTPADVFASIANFLVQKGWQGDQTWGREVRLPLDFDQGLIGLSVEKPLSEWQRLGVRRIEGGDLPARELGASIVRPDSGRAFLVYANFRVLMEWNRSTYFALAVGQLADRLSL